jgi:hypothetical protein
MALILGSSPELKLDSRLQNQIANATILDPILAGQELESDALKKQYLTAIHRPTGCSNRYNCHGLSFASRRTRIWDSAEIAKILREDDYVKIPLTQVLPGDIAIYLQEGDVAHSGIVVEVPAGPIRIPKILGKWGFSHEVVHSVYDSPYGTNVEYYRIQS